MCTAIFSLWLKLCNWFFLLCALGITGFFVYLTATAHSTLTYICLGLSLYFLLIALVGLLATRKSSQGLFRLYVVCHSSLVIFEGVVVCGLLFSEDKTLQVIKDLDTSGNGKEVNTAQTYVQDHANSVKFVTLVFLVVQLVSIFVAACCGDSLAARNARFRRLEDEENPASGGDKSGKAGKDGKQPLLSEQDNVQTSAHPKTDGHRAAMVAKYGDRISRSSSSTGGAGSSSSSSFSRPRVELGNHGFGADD